MEFYALHEQLRTALNKIKDVVPKDNKVYVPILAYVLLSVRDEKLIISATDTETSLITTIPCQVKEPGNIAVLYSRFKAYVDSFEEGQFKFTLNDDQTKLCLKINRSTARIPAMPSEEFPHIGISLDGPMVNVDVRAFIKAVKLVDYAVSTDDTERPVLHGIHLVCDGKTLVLESADGFRLSMFTIHMEDQKPFNVVVPGIAMHKMATVMTQEEGELTISLVNDGQTIMFATSNFTFSSQLITGEFPDVQRILRPKSTTVATMGREDMLKAVKQSLIMAKEADNIIIFEFSRESKNVIVRSSETIVGHVTVNLPAEIEGDDVDLAVNGRFLTAVLSSLQTAKVEFGLKGKTQPVMILGVGEDYFSHMIMPMHLGRR